MASDVEEPAQHVIDKGKGLAQDVETITDSTTELPSPEICVICLDRISEKAVALPCRHDQFDFPCLGTWIQKSQVCPLCKGEVRAIQYDVDQKDKRPKVFHLLPSKEIPRSRPLHDINRRRERVRRIHAYGRSVRYQRRQDERADESKEDQAMEFRREVYRRSLYSAYVGTNRISRYRNITPQSFATNASLVTRAKTFIRRELQVFDFLNPSSATLNHRQDRRASNAEFLLEYIVGILKSIDLKGSTGQAEELLKDFLGREHARLFLHELEAWLRSPYERLWDWDRHVQYGSVVQVRDSNEC